MVSISTHPMEGASKTNQMELSSRGPSFQLLPTGSSLSVVAYFRSNDTGVPSRLSLVRLAILSFRGRVGRVGELEGALERVGEELGNALVVGDKEGLSD